MHICPWLREACNFVLFCSLWFPYLSCVCPLKQVKDTLLFCLSVSVPWASLCNVPVPCFSCVGENLPLGFSGSGACLWEVVNLLLQFLYWLNNVVWFPISFLNEIFVIYYLLNLLGWHWLIKVCRFQVYNSKYISPVYRIMRSPPQVKSPSITIYSPLTTSTCP